MAVMAGGSGVFQGGFWSNIEQDISDIESAIGNAVDNLAGNPTPAPGQFDTSTMLLIGVGIVVLFLLLR
jgi:hypothetical protein